MAHITFTVELADGQTHDVESSNPDTVRWDMFATKHGYDMNKSPFVWQTYMSWCALVRLGLYSGQWDQFAYVDCVDVEPIIPEGAEDDAPDPTRPVVPLA